MIKSLEFLGCRLLAKMFSHLSKKHHTILMEQYISNLKKRSITTATIYLALKIKYNAIRIFIENVKRECYFFLLI